MFGCIRRRRRRGLIIQVLWLLVRKVNKLMKDVTDLDGAIAALKTKVDSITPAAPPVPLDLTPQVDAVNAVTAELNTKFPPAA